MTLELRQIGELTAQLMERLEEDYADIEAEVGVVAVIVELNYVHSNGDDISAIEYRCSDGRRWVQTGLFDAAKRAVIEFSENPDEDDA